MSACSVCWRGTRGPAAAGEQPEAVVEPRGDLVRRHRRHPRRGELDRERDPVEAAADLSDGVDVRLAEGERRIGGGGPCDEQPDRLGRGGILQAGSAARERTVGPTGRRAGQGPDVDHGLPGDRKCLSARGQDA